MSVLSILPVTLPIMVCGSRPFVAMGGTSPYTFSILNGPGSIDSSGVFTASNIPGLTTVLVTDSLGARATARVTGKTAIQLFCDILQTELGLEDGQVYLWDQKINIPTDYKLYIAVGVLSCKPFGNTRTSDGSGSGLNEIQSTNFQAILDVNILSRGTEARDRKEEVVLALNSVYSEQQQESNGFYVATLPSGFVNLSQEDGAAIPYRFNISVAIQYFITKTKAVPYYDTFQTVGIVTEP